MNCGEEGLAAIDRGQHVRRSPHRNELRVGGGTHPRNHGRRPWLRCEDVPVVLSRAPTDRLGGPRRNATLTEAAWHADVVGWRTAAWRIDVPGPSGPTLLRTDGAPPPSRRHDCDGISRPTAPVLTLKRPRTVRQRSGMAVCFAPGWTLSEPQRGHATPFGPRSATKNAPAVASRGNSWVRSTSLVPAPPVSMTGSRATSPVAEARRIAHSIAPCSYSTPPFPRERCCSGPSPSSTGPCLRRAGGGRAPPRHPASVRRGHGRARRSDRPGGSGCYPPGCGRRPRARLARHPRIVASALDRPARRAAALPRPPPDRSVVGRCLPRAGGRRAGPAASGCRRGASADAGRGRGARRMVTRSRRPQWRETGGP